HHISPKPSDGPRSLAVPANEKKKVNDGRDQYADDREAEEPALPERVRPAPRDVQHVHAGLLHRVAPSVERVVVGRAPEPEAPASRPGGRRGGGTPERNRRLRVVVSLG
ncbi:hypothetical protein THAOC_08827, partial [Thalassiosira oceanica]